MVDQMNPNTQFHPYQPPEVDPIQRGSGGTVAGMLKKIGLDEHRMNSIRGSLSNMNMRGSVDKVRGYARNNPAMTLGGLAAAVIGAGLIARRRRATTSFNV